MNSDNIIREQLLDISTSYLVQAPAGSGKTSILVQRYLSALAAVNEAPEEVIAITFTRKAQGEMRARILNALQDAEVSPEPSNPYLAKLWNLARRVLKRDKTAGWNILDNPTRLKIQTIDALCASITKQMPILSNFGTKPQVTDNPGQLYIAAAEQLVQSCDGKTNHDYQDALYKLLLHLDNDRLKVIELLQQLLGKREHWLPLLGHRNNLVQLRKYLEYSLELVITNEVSNIELNVPQSLDFGVMSLDLPQNLTDWLLVADKVLTKEGSLRKTVSAKQGFHPPSKATNKDEKQRLKAAKDAMQAMLKELSIYHDFIKQLHSLRILPPTTYTNETWQIVESLLVLLPYLAANLTLVFKEVGQVDFIAIALNAIDALGASESPSDLALELDYKIKHILVDEFQDTSHIQYMLLEKLTSNWQQLDGRTLFLVGDPMQSIYSFRQADVGLFIKARDEGIGNIKLEFKQLTSNFRAKENIIAWVNKLFINSFPTIDDRILGAIPYTKSVAYNPSATHAGAKCIAVDDELAPQQIIALINRTWESNSEASIAVLVRARTHLNKLLPALREANIPYQGYAIETLLQRPIIQDLLSLAKALLHLDDRISWLALLRAPWSGITLPDLQIIADYEGTIFAALSDNTILQSLSKNANYRVTRINLIMQDALGCMGRIALTDILVKTANALGISQFITDRDIEQEIAIFYRFMEDQQYKPEIYTPNFLDAELAKLYLQTEAIAGQAVQIMTIHKAKGLEFDVVILPYLHRSTRSNSQELLLLESREYEQQCLLLAPIRAAKEKNDPLYQYLAWCKRNRLEYESLRELYVAVTRARDNIYCLADIKENQTGSGMLKNVWEHIAWQFEYSECQSVSADIVNQRTLKRLPQEWLDKNSYVEQHIRTKPHKVMHFRNDWVNKVGTVVHRILCHIATIGVENLPKSYLEDIPSIVTPQFTSLGLPKKFISEAMQVVMKSINSICQDSFGRFLLSNQHNESYAEWSLTTVEGNEYKQYRLDRVIVDKDDIVWLVDYKVVLSDYKAEVRRYLPQMQQYSKLIQELKPNKKLVFGLYFPLQKLWQPL